MSTSTKPKKKSALEAAAETQVSKLDRDRDGGEFDATNSVQRAEVRTTLRRNRLAGFIKLELIEPDPDQPRTVKTSGEDFEGLVESIQLHGVISPITVRAIDGGRYQIITGERRYRAAQIIGLEEIPALVRDVDDTAKAVEQLVENIQREDMNPVEEARALHRLEATGLTHDEIARKLGKKRVYVTELLSLPKRLSAEEQEHLAQCRPADIPGKSLILAALRTDDSETRWAILTGKMTRAEARAATAKKPKPTGRPRNYSKKFNVPGATVTVTLKTSEADDAAVEEALRIAWQGTQET